MPCPKFAFSFIKRVCSPVEPGWTSVLGQKETFSPALLSSFTTGAWKNAHFRKRRAHTRSILKASSVLGTSGVNSFNDPMRQVFVSPFIVEETEVQGVKTFVQVYTVRRQEASHVSGGERSPPFSFHSKEKSKYSRF